MSEENNYSKMKKKELEALAIQKGLEIEKCTKADLVARLEALDAGHPDPNSVKAEKKTKTTSEDKIRQVLRDTNLILPDAIKALLNAYETEDLIESVLPVVYSHGYDKKKPPVLEVEHTEETLSKLKVVELKKILDSMDKKVSGNKKTLIARILGEEEKK